MNLIALRRLKGGNDGETQAVRRYLLGLSLIAATAEIDLYLREGCNLRIADEDNWELVPRRGDVQSVALTSDLALAYAKSKVDALRSEWPTDLLHKFDLDEAKKLLAKRADEDEADE